MKINYWECEYQDCDSYYDENEGEIYEYNCRHPDNSSKYCQLDNKCNDDCADCFYMNKE